MNIYLDDNLKGIKKVTRLSKFSYLFDYPCESLSDCTFYHVILPQGEYLFELWGGEGGYCGGKGGYSQGVLRLYERTQLEVHIGAKGPQIVLEKGNTSFGYNGGGAAFALDDKKSAGAGGGGTDVRISGSTLNHRVIVAGGGGGGSFNGGSDYCGGAAGGVEGKIGMKRNGTDAPGGNQKNPGIGEAGYGTDESGKTHSGIFGHGGYTSCTGGSSTGGGGGWYGGAGGAPSYHSGGGGGSGYVLSADSYKPKDYAHNNSKYFFSHPILSDGTQLIPIPSSNESEIGHTGNGAFKLTILSLCTNNIGNQYLFYNFHYLSLILVIIS